MGRGTYTYIKLNNFNHILEIDGERITSSLLLYSMYPRDSGRYLNSLFYVSQRLGKVP